MKVLMIGAGNPPPTFIQRQIHGLSERRVEVVHPVFPTKHRYLAARMCRYGFPFLLPRSTLSLARSADIIHFQWPGHWLTYHALAQQFKKPSVLSLRGRQINITPHLPAQAKYARDLKRWLPKCNAYHCVSHDILRNAEALGLDPSRAWVIRPAVDPSFFCPASTKPSQSPFRIAMVGALMWRKGYEYAILAMREVLDQLGTPVLLTIVGEGPEQARITQAIYDLDLGGVVTLVGKLHPEGIREVLQSCHVFWLTSLSEGIANSVLEAMSCGLPVIVTECGGLREAVTDQSEGFVVPVRDPHAVATRTMDLASDTATRDRLGREARERILRRVSLEQQVSQFVALYQDLVTESSKMKEYRTLLRSLDHC